MDERERAQDAREAGDRRAALAELGVPADAIYHWMDIASAGPGDVTARYGVVFPDGRLGLVTQHPVVELPGQSWPRPYRLTIYGVPAGHGAAIALLLAAAGLPVRVRALPLFEMHPWGPEGAAVRLIPLRVTAHHPATPLYAERRLRADLSWGDRVPGLEYRHTAAQRALAEAGLAHLRDWVARHAGGRPAGAGKRFALGPADVVDAYHQLQHAPGAHDPKHQPEDERPTYQEVADRLLLTRRVVLSGRTLERRVREDWRRAWPPTGWPEWDDWELQEEREEDG